MKKIILLHGALGSGNQLLPLADAIKDAFQTEILTFSGHGGNESLPVFSIQNFANDLENFILQSEKNSVNIFGYSMGGYVALYLARHKPYLINKIFTIATKFHWTEASAIHETKMLDTENIKEKVPRFARVLEERHFPADWEKVVSKTADMMLALGKNPALNDEDFTRIHIPVFLSVGELDKMVSAEETMHVHELLPTSYFEILSGIPHPLEKIPTDMLAGKIINWFGAG